MHLTNEAAAHLRFAQAEVLGNVSDLLQCQPDVALFRPGAAPATAGARTDPKDGKATISTTPTEKRNGFIGSTSLTQTDAGMQDRPRSEPGDL